MEINGTWKGEYIYGDDYPEKTIGNVVKFTVHLSSNGSDIEGSFTDEETIAIFPDGGALKGVFENNYLSMIKQYPHAWGITEEGALFFRENEASQLIIYEGFYNKGKYEGKWEIPLFYPEDTVEGSDFTYSEIAGSGTWWMSKVE